MYFQAQAISKGGREARTAQDEQGMTGALRAQGPEHSLQTVTNWEIEEGEQGGDL